MDSNQVVEAVQNMRAGAGTGPEHEMTLDDMAAELCRHALRLGSADNVTAVIIDFDFE